jgi:hypothetical protein
MDTSSNYWKYMLMYYFLMATINLLSFLFIFRYDTPNFYNKKNDEISKKKRYRALLEIHHFKNVMSELLILEKL